MIVVNANLLSAVDGSITSIGNIKIYNDCTGTNEVGNYKIVCYGFDGTITAEGEVKGFKRQSLDFLELLRQSLNNVERVE